jgi:hypothetical protein
MCCFQIMNAKGLFTVGVALGGEVLPKVTLEVDELNEKLHDESSAKASLTKKCSRLLQISTDHPENTTAAIDSNAVAVQAAARQRHCEDLAERALGAGKHVLSGNV